ncbi:transposase [Streptomyces pseudovenezuelae]|uniref:transposase n=1 Tax=Streptomyces pseudovenezuelae TaxID=67350 RepID=UPI00247722F4|nr:transposase [Streptomyces pseudovenezuelae]
MFTVSKRRKFDAEFREGAVRIAAGTGKAIAQVAKDLGINETTLASWVSRQGSSESLGFGVITGQGSRRGGRVAG